MTARLRGCLLALAMAAAACSSSQGSSRDLALDGLTIVSVQPAGIVPGSEVTIEGRSLVEEPWGKSYLQLDGVVTGSAGTVEVHAAIIPAQFVDYDHLKIDVDGETFAALGADDGHFEGEARIVVDSGVDSDRHASEPIAIELDFSQTLTPSLGSLQKPSVTFLNSEAIISGSGFLLGGNEGATVALIEGLFETESGGFNEIGPIVVELKPTNPFSRDEAIMRLSPAITGIEPGYFVGTVVLQNQHLGGDEVDGLGLEELDYDLVETTVFGVSTAEVSLGQYMLIEGGGFVEDGGTTVRVEGSFTPDGASEAIPIADLIELVPQFVDGQTLRYVLNELDLPIDLRTDSGLFEGELIPILSYDGVEVEGSSGPFSIRIAPVKQVVYLRFTPNFVEALRAFGLRAAENKIRDRVVAVVQRDYRTINLEVRTDRPDDFALYAEVDIGGKDPHDLGLLGYDNTPGKDVNNLRLHDRLGGVNAQTQYDGYPGYGGVFVESLFAFSKHPISGVAGVPSADGLFDDIFDPFRPDDGGEPLRAADLQGGINVDIDASQCPATSREKQVECAVFVLGNLVGTTLSHEIGHSLGLANPYGSAFHNPFDEPNRLMDGGGDRPFTERAQLLGDGPGLFCQDEYEYLREILRTDETADPQPRPGCF